MFCTVTVAALSVSACGSSTASSGGRTGSVRTVCSLLPVAEAASAFGGPVQGPASCAVGPGSRSGGLYHRPFGPGNLIVDVSWDKRTVQTFTVAHSGTATYLDGAQPPRYSKVTVAGATAYWQESPSPGPGNSQRLSSLKDGDVVTLTAMDLDPSQVERALAAILGRL